MYKKGIETLKHDILKFNENDQNYSQQLQLNNQQQASALASIAELFMTEPLCDEEDAESNCELSLKEALLIDSQNLDALQCLGNLRMLRTKDKEAVKLLTKVADKVCEIS
jgi:hypothetical protein